MYVEASSPASEGQKARLCSKNFQAPSNKRLTFKYHSYADPSTKLRVLVKTSTEEKVLQNYVGFNNNNGWLNGSITIKNDVNFRVS